MINIAIIGAGNMGIMHSLAYKKISNANVVAIVDVNTEFAENLAKDLGAKPYKSMEEAANDQSIQVADICLPSYLHYEFVGCALDMGLNVFCEKPIALNLQDANALLEKAKQKGLKYMIAHCLRFSDEYNYLKERIDNHQYGKLLSLTMYRHTAIPAWDSESWFTDESKSGGLFIDLHLHDTDMVLYLLGSPDAVISSGTPYNISTLYEYKDRSDLTVYAEASWRKQSKYPFSMGYDALFEKASVIYNGDIIKVYTDADEMFEINLAPVVEESGKVIGNVSEKLLQIYINEAAYFLQCVEKDEAPAVCLPDSSAKALEIVLAEKESVDTGKKVYLR